MVVGVAFTRKDIDVANGIRRRRRFGTFLNRCFSAQKVELEGPANRDEVSVPAKVNSVYPWDLHVLSPMHRVHMGLRWCIWFV